MNRAGSVWFWSLLGAFIAAALGTAINFATDLKTSFLAWGFVVAFTLATGIVSAVSQVMTRRDGSGSKASTTTNVYNVQHSQVNVWLVFLILGVSGSLLAAIFVGVHFAGSIQTAGTPLPAATEPRPAPPLSSTTTTLPVPTTTSTVPRPVVNEDITEFVTGYYRLMPDTRAGWPLIGPNLQRRGLTDYEAHWGRISAVDVHSASATSATTVRVRVTLHYRDGRASLETHELTVVPCDGHLCIDADTLVRGK
ncbi:serine/threonine protein kinase [Amycolatopsis sp. lyj-90]|uniref:serine/threonine protein kinase n=1 Tax=Amycolatopsis sp. lyj-90 TaxID=2789285 RepID=UPI00397B0508